MAEYKPAFDNMIWHEDYSLSGITQVDNDGGKVRFGLNSKSHPEVEQKGYYNLPRLEALTFAEDFYYRNYWNVVNGTNIKEQVIANKVFDQSVPMGPWQCVEILQQVLDSGLTVDGHIGPKTLTVLNNTDPVNLLADFKAALQDFYQKLVQRRPQDEKYLKGWIARALS